MNQKELLQKQIYQKELQLKKLQQNYTDSEICSDLYNSIVLEKAILKKKLDDMNKNPIVESIKKAIPHKKTLICDYFN